jgi:hypothetical protein
LGYGVEIPSGGHYVRFGLMLSTTGDGMFSLAHDHDLSIHSSKTEDAIAALDLLAGLQDSYFIGIKLEYFGDRNGICPLSGRHLENFVRNPNRVNIFAEMAFTPDQCRTLATSGIITNIGFWVCSFEDGGIEFVEASASRENQESGPAKLSIWGSLLFDEGHFRVFISQHNIESLALYCVHLHYEESCRALAAADLQNLELSSCRMVDGGAALVESVGEGRGPRALSLEAGLFDSQERFISFINVLPGNTYLQRLDLPYNFTGEGFPKALLASALLENKGLVHFGLFQCRLDGHSWSELMAAISTHPTLRTLKFGEIYNVGGLLVYPVSSSTKRDRTKVIANMLLVNKHMHIDDIPFCCEVSFDRDDLDALVAPIVDYNLYRKRFVPIQKIKALSTRAAIVARALARVEKNPSLVWMILSQNHDVIRSYLLNEAREISASVPLRSKRRRSPSNDDQDVHV